MIKCSALVSIIVPVYGTESYLPACIDSICGQTYSNIQIILVDDQSPDRCPEICDDYAKKDSRILVLHQTNKGVSGARNAGMRCADGTYIMFVDSDDELHPEAVSLLVHEAEQCGADIISGSMKRFGKWEDMNLCCEDSIRMIFHDDEPLLLSLNGDQNTESACAKLFKKNFIKDITFEEGKSINEDGFFVFECYLRKPILVQHNAAVYQYNTREMSASRQSFSEKYLSMLWFCEQKMKLVKEYFPQYIEQAYNMVVRTHLQFLQVLCRTTEKKYSKLYKDSAKTVRKLYKYHKPINDHHRKMAWMVVHGLYPLYKKLVRLKYYR